MGPLCIDLFVSQTNHQLPEYCSWRPDPTAMAVDAFSVSWSLSFPSYQSGREIFDQDSDGDNHLRLPNSSSLAGSELLSSIARHAYEEANHASTRKRSSSEPRTNPSPSDILEGHLLGLSQANLLSAGSFRHSY